VLENLLPEAAKCYVVRLAVAKQTGVLVEVVFERRSRYRDQSELVGTALLS
jgi:hypothetical protein